MKSLSSQAGIHNTENDMPRLVDIENISDAIQKQLYNDCLDVYDYHVGAFHSFANTELIVRCIIGDLDAKQGVRLLNSYCFRIKFDSRSISRGLQNILDDIELDKDGIKLEIRTESCRKIKKYLSDYYDGEVRIFGNKVVIDDIYIYYYGISKI